MPDAHLHTFLYPRARQRYWDADDALYEHEEPFYRYCASGFPMIFEDRDWYSRWQARRAVLERRWGEARKTMDALKVMGRTDA